MGLGLSCRLEVEFCVINIALASLTIIERVHIQLSRKTTQSNQQQLDKVTGLTLASPNGSVTGTFMEEGKLQKNVEECMALEKTF